MNISEIKLTAGRSLIHSHVPDNVHLCNGQSCNVVTKKSIAQFGLFETNSPNFNTYYPDVDAKDLQPSEDQYINPIFRALSQLSVRKHLPVDFSKGTVLRDSMSKLVGISLMTDHEQNTGNVIGAVKSASWQEGYTVEGLKVPAGINVKLNIDGKSHPKIARGILSDPPSYHSVSVTVMYAWEWSHKKLENPYSKWGMVADDGKIVRKVATEIKLYSEISIVPLGADPFARLLKDGKVTNPKFIANRTSLSETLTSHNALDSTVDNFQDVASFSDTEFNPKIDKDMNVSEFLESIGQDSMSDDQFKALVQKGITASTELAAIKAVKSDINPTNLAALQSHQKSEAEIATLAFVTEKGGQEVISKAIEATSNAVTAQRESAVKFYKLCKGDKFSEEIVSNINATEGAALKAMEAQYRDEYEEKVPLSCGSCGSTAVSRKSSEQVSPAQAVLSFREKQLAKHAKDSGEAMHA